MKRIKNKIKTWLSSVVVEAIKSAPIEQRVGEEIEKLRYDYLPHGACWMCSMPVSRKGGYEMWTGKMFCTRNCTEKYASLIQKPDNSFQYMKSVDGTLHPVEVFTPKQ